MTTSITAHLALIRAECHRVIELEKAATAGPWKVINASFGPYGSQPRISTSDETTKVADLPALTNAGGQINIRAEEIAANATFIATSRQFTPAAAKGVIAQIDAQTKTIELAEQITRLPWGYDGDGGSVGIAEDIIEQTTEALQSLANEFAYLLP